VRNDHQAYADRVADRLRGDGLRVDVVAADEKLGARVRRAKLEKIPYVLVVGDDDVGAGTVGVNRRGKDQAQRGVSVEAFSEAVRAEDAARTA
jgi:threonyl-tRNA synthetase